jgi:hypothetical protein
MPNEPTPPLTDLENAEEAYKRVEPEASALTEDQFTAQNVDVVGATSTILGVAPRILSFRERMARLPEFDISNVDRLVVRAKAAWFSVITNLPEPEPKDFDEMLRECEAIRETLLVWAGPLVHANKFEQKAINAIKEGSGNKDTLSDVVALVNLYRSKWDEVKAICGVTEAMLDRGAAIAPVVFATASRRDNKVLPSQTDGALRVRRFWTLADRSYDQCQRALAYLRWTEGDALLIAPSLRRNASGRATPQDPPTPASPPPAPPAPPAPAGPVVGGGSGPFDR